MNKQTVSTHAHRRITLPFPHPAVAPTRPMGLTILIACFLSLAVGAAGGFFAHKSLMWLPASLNQSKGASITAEAMEMARVFHAEGILPHDEFLAVEKAFTEAKAQ